MATQTLVRPTTPPHDPVRLPAPCGPTRSPPASSTRRASGCARSSWPAGPRTTTYRASAPAVRAPRLAPVAPRATGVRITRRGRLALLMVLTVLALVIGAIVQAAGAPAVAAPDGSTSGGAVTRTVTVAPGETLWQIARDVRPNADPRETVARIREASTA